MMLYNGGYFINRLNKVVQVFEENYNFYDKDGVIYNPDGECKHWGTHNFDLIKFAKKKI